MELLLKRMYKKIDYTIGFLYINNEYFCDTLEDKVRDLNEDGDLQDPGEAKVYGETAIPYGRYRIILTHSPKLKRELPLLLHVPEFEGILIHAGATCKNTLGCILVGKNKFKGQLSQGRTMENELMRRLKESKEKIFITIV